MYRHIKVHEGGKAVPISGDILFDVSTILIMPTSPDSLTWN